MISTPRKILSFDIHIISKENSKKFPFLDVENHWLNKHFNCQLCQTHLPFEYYSVEEIPLCRSCYFKNFICPSCTKPITKGNAVMDSSHKKFHPECYFPYHCSKCKNGIHGNIHRVY